MHCVNRSPLHYRTLTVVGTTIGMTDDNNKDADGVMMEYNRQNECSSRRTVPRDTVIFMATRFIIIPSEGELSSTVSN